MNSAPQQKLLVASACKTTAWYDMYVCRFCSCDCVAIHFGNSHQPTPSSQSGISVAIDAVLIERRCEYHPGGYPPHTPPTTMIHQLWTEVVYKSLLCLQAKTWQASLRKTSNMVSVERKRTHRSRSYSNSSVVVQTQLTNKVSWASAFNELITNEPLLRTRTDDERAHRERIQRESW